MTQHKGELDRRVARKLRMRALDVSRVTAEFIAQMSAFLEEAGYVTVHMLGTLSVTVVHRSSNFPARLTTGTFKKGGRAGTRKVIVPPYVRVDFKQAVGLKKRLKKAHRK